MMLLGMGIAVTVPYLVLFATKDLGMTTTQYGLLLALAAVSQFVVNSIIARFSDTHNVNRKVLIISALFMGAVSFSIYFYVHQIWLFIVLYAIFQGLFAPAMPQLYASARESINISSSRDRAKFANTVLRSMFSLDFIWSLYRVTINRIKWIFWVIWWNGSYSIVHLNSTSLFYQNLPVEYQVSSQHHVENPLQICLKIKHYLFRLFFTYWTMDVHDEYAVIRHKLSKRT